MRLLILPLLGALLSISADAQAQAKKATATAVTSATLDESEVRITYGELKRLVAATLPPPVPPPAKAVPPVPAALLSAVYRLDATKRTLMTEMQVENFDGGWRAVPITGADTSPMAVLPVDARLVVTDARLCLMTNQAGTTGIELMYALAPEGQGTTLPLAEAAVTSLELSGLPEGKALRVLHGSTIQVLTANGTAALPAGGGEVTLLIEEARQESLIGATGAVTDDALITSAAYTTQIVRDGSVLTEGSLIVRHDLPVRLSVSFPEGAKLLQCHVNASPVRPTTEAGGAFVIALDDPTTDGAESEVKLSFTQAMPALHPAEGEIALALPRMPLFARQIDWTLRMPAMFDLSCSGNVDVIAAPAAPAGTAAPSTSELHLRKALCRDQQPQALVTYRKR